jgi:hypothetical protein
MRCLTVSRGKPSISAISLIVIPSILFISAIITKKMRNIPHGEHISIQPFSKIKKILEKYSLYGIFILIKYSLWGIIIHR